MSHYIAACVSSCQSYLILRNPRIRSTCLQLVKLDAVKNSTYSNVNINVRRNEVGVPSKVLSITSAFSRPPAGRRFRYLAV